MRVPRGCRTKIRRYPSGKRVKVVLDACDRVVEKVNMRSLSKRTRTSKRLSRTRRRIGL